MAEPSLPLRRLVEHVLGKGGDLPLALLLETLVPVKELRRLARDLGLSPKGFRVDRAPARVLATQLAELRESEQVEQLLELLRPPAAAAPAKEVDDADSKADLEALLQLREGELLRSKADAEDARAAAARARDRLAEVQRQVEQLELDLARARGQAAKTQVPREPKADRSAAERELQRRVRDLEALHEGFVASDEALRRQLAHNQTRMRRLEADNAELTALVPKGKRKKPPPPPEEDRRVLVPRFLPSFYKSLDGKERKSIERAIAAIFLFCTEGHAYPGLEVKQLGGQDTWSLRASLGLRVYFRPVADGDIEILELGDREDQNTTLRRLKDRS